MTLVGELLSGALTLLLALLLVAALVSPVFTVLAKGGSPATALLSWLSLVVTNSGFLIGGLVGTLAIVGVSFVLRALLRAGYVSALSAAVDGDPSPVQCFFRGMLSIFDRVLVLVTLELAFKLVAWLLAIGVCLGGPSPVAALGLSCAVLMGLGGMACGLAATAVLARRPSIWVGEALHSGVALLGSKLSELLGLAFVAAFAGLVATLIYIVVTGVLSTLTSDPTAMALAMMIRPVVELVYAVVALGIGLSAWAGLLLLVSRPSGARVR